ncbi:MAG: STAS/SEC14 domain-containing protein [Cyclobacteriaceae bacterium]|nr:STAS/SEC14 domain-containing protein [Cyclobacteriaceae bacterium]MCH8517074.1 STAS/SEC14 domain-containing protein [Cyclobacteriaceae bacterium]
MSKFVSNDFVDIWYDEEYKAIINIWKTPPTTDEFKEGMNQTIEAFKKYGTGVLISHTSDLGALDPEDQEWSTTDWISRALPAGYRKFAVITSPDIFAKMSVEETLTEVKTAHATLEIQYFPTEEEARKWIKESENL